MRILADWSGEIKAGRIPPVLADTGLALIIILSVTAAFALGRMSALEEQKEPVRIYNDRGVEISDNNL
ncbi:MAG: hypothetical protein AAB597_02245 [Patescibacteria group bacterium]